MSSSPLFTAYDWIAHHARRSPGKLAAVDESSGRRLTYAQLDGRVSRLAGYLAGEMGVRPGERVAMLLANSADAFELQFACFRLGAILLPLNWRLRLPELEYLAGDASPRVLVYDAQFQEQAQGMLQSTPVEHLLLRDGSPDSPYERAAAAGRPGAPVIARMPDTCTILYTAGTTGLPKGALITHQMTLFNAINIGMATDLTSKSVCLVTLPVFHTGGLNLYANPVFHLGGTVVVQRTFDPERTLALISDPELGVTHFFGVPAMYQQMCQSPAFAGADLTRLVATGVGGAPCPLSLLEAWAVRGCRLQQGFGMTETSPSALVMPREMATARVGSVGLPVMHGEAMVADTEGRPVAAGETGELWVRGPHVTPGYWMRPEATAESFTDGWLHTGDAARVDDDGYFYIVDRWKDMYISGGENVYPAEVENAIYQLEEVSEVAVIGVPDERWGEVGRALVVLKAGRTLTQAQVIEHCRSRLAGYKCPRSAVFLEQPLPRNAAGKVLKNELRSVHARSFK